MAKRTYHVLRDENGRPMKGKDGKFITAETQGYGGLFDAPRGSVTKAHRKSTTEIPFTKGPQTRGQRIARALWG